jgi:hypothetical protein
MRFKRVAQVMRIYLGEVFRIIDSPVIDELIPNIEEEGFRGHVRAKQSRQLILIILEHREAEMTLGGVALYSLRRFRGVWVDADKCNASRLVV